MTRIDINEANTHFLEVMQRVANGEEVIIEQNERAVARISPLPEIRQPRRFGSAEGMIQLAEDFDEPLDDFAAYQ